MGCRLPCRGGYFGVAVAISYSRAAFWLKFGMRRSAQVPGVFAMKICGRESEVRVLPADDSCIDSDRINGGVGGEGGSFVHSLLASPGSLPDAVKPAALLAVSLLLSAALISFVTAALTR